MATKYSDVSVLQTMTTKIATGVNINVCSAQPANYAGISAVSLASVTVTSGDWTASTTGSGATIEAVLTAASKSGISVTASGTAIYLTVDDGTTLLEGTTITSQAITSGGTTTIGSWTVTVTQPI